MSAAPTDREIRPTEIPGELRRLRAEVDHWRQQHALEFTRAEATERRAKKAEQQADDWRAIALHNGFEAADARLDAARERQSRESERAAWASEADDDMAELGRVMLARDLAHDRARDALCALQGVLDSIEYRAKHNHELRESVGRVLDDYPHFTERCEACGGWDAETPATFTCTGCFGGNVLLEVK